MALTVTPNLSLVSTCDAVTGWSGYDNLDDVDFVQGGASLNAVVRNETTYFTFTKASPYFDLSPTDTHVYFWAKTALIGLGSMGATGFALRLTDSSGNWSEWNMDISDWDGSWKCFVQDPTATRTTGSGTLNLASISGVGIKFVSSTLVKNVPNSWVDVVRFGTGLTGYGTGNWDFGDIAAIDDSLSNKYGVLQLRNGILFCQGRITIGDGTNATEFKSTDEVLVFLKRAVTNTLYQIATNAVTTGTWNFQIGEKVGTGDTARGRNGTTFLGADSTVQYKIDFSDADWDVLKIYGSVFRFAGQGVVLSSNTAHEFIGNTIDQSAQFVAAQTQIRNCTFSGYTPDTDGALLWNSTINIKNCNFIANADATNDPHAIEHPAASAGEDYIGLVFSGNDYDINFSAASGTLVINATNSNPSTYEITGGGSTVTINNAVTLEVEVLDKSGSPVNLAQCAIYRASDGQELMNEDTNTSGIATESFNYTGATDIYYRVRKSSTGATKYIPAEGTGQITSNGFSVTVTFIEDEIAAP